MLQYTVSNRMVDGGMEFGNSWPTVGSTATAVFTTAEAYMGEKSLKVNNSTSGTAAGVYSRAMSVPAGKSYTF